MEKSVSRIGKKAQSSLMKWVTTDYKAILIQYLRLSDLLLSGVPLSENQELTYNNSLIGVGV